MILIFKLSLNTVCMKNRDPKEAKYGNLAVTVNKSYRRTIYIMRVKGT